MSEAASPGSAAAIMRTFVGAGLPDCSAIARKHGGGGHKRAAGFSTDLELEDLVAFLCDEVELQLGA